MTLPQRLAVVVAALFVIGSIAAAFLPTSPEGATCGTWVSPEWGDEETDAIVDEARNLAESDVTGEYGGEAFGIAANARMSQRLCDDALGTRRTLTIVALGLAVVVPVGVLFVGATRRPG